jgi:hypothetical protein
MPIDLETLKCGLLPVQQAYASFKQAAAARKEAATAGTEFDSLIEAEGTAHAAYVDACMVLHGFVRGMVNVAEGRPAHKDE